MRIHNYEVGPSHPVFIVAEIGSNHGGSKDAAIALIDAAADAGANAVKFQLWLSADEMYDREQFVAEWTSADRWRLPVEWLPALRNWAHERGMAFGLSSFGFASLDVADEYVDFHKVASIESTWAPFVRAVVDKRKPTLVSHGMTVSTVERVGDEEWWWSEHEHIISLHCVVAYPAEISETHLRSRPPISCWGFSDHTTDPTIAPCAAVALGACVIEKHLRLGLSVVPEYEDAPPDAPHSLDQWEFKEMVSAIRLTEQVLGSSEKRIRESEKSYLRYRRGPRGLRGA